MKPGLLPMALAAATLLAGLAGAARAVGIAEVPTPRPAGWTVDLTGTLRAEDRQALDRLGDEVKAQTGAELAVVVVGSTDGVPPRQFATYLFNRWRIGERDKRNGLLVFAALDDRAAEIVLGGGIYGPREVRESQEVMQGEMVPRFRAGDPGGAVFYGALACARQILGASPTVAPGVGEGAGPEDRAVVQPAPAPIPLRPAVSERRGTSPVLTRKARRGRPPGRTAAASPGRSCWEPCRSPRRSAGTPGTGAAGAAAGTAAHSSSASTSGPTTLTSSWASRWKSGSAASTTTSGIAPAAGGWRSSATARSSRATRPARGAVRGRGVLPRPRSRTPPAGAKGWCGWRRSAPPATTAGPPPTRRRDCPS